MWTNFPLRRTAEGRPWCGFVRTVRWLCLNPLMKIESAYFRVKVRKLDRHAVKMHRRRRQTAGDEPLCGSGDGFPLHQPRSPICSFFSATPFDTQPLSAAGGRSSFINNQCASYTICQHVCDVMCVCVCSPYCRGDRCPFQVCRWNKMASQLHVGPLVPANARYPRHLRAAEGIFLFFSNCCTPGADFLAA